jgi:E1A/CREB-binding protein
MAPAAGMMAPYHNSNAKPIVAMPPAVPPTKREARFDGAPPLKRVKTEGGKSDSNNAKKLKAEKKKNQQGTSLLECFNTQQIKRHMATLQTETAAAQSAAGKAAVTDGAKPDKSECCVACGQHNLLFEPPPLYCLNCNNRIKKGQTYWFTMVNDTHKHSVCGACHKDHIKDSLKVEGKNVPKSKLKKKKNEEKLLEPWVQCDYCDAWVHQVCALFNKVRDEGGAGQYACPNCLVKKMEKGTIKQITSRPQAMLEAKDLAKTKLSDFLEQRIAKFLTQERQVRATALGKKPSEVPTATGLMIRIVNSNDKLFSVLPNFFKHFEKDKIAGEMKYKSKILLLFQKVEGVDLCLFCMYVQEYGKECPAPNTRRTYLSYLDSVRYFKPEGITAFGGDKNGRGDSLRTLVYQELIMGYLQYLKDRGFTSMYIWACPPLPGDDYIFYVHPQRQKTPKSDRLREWYLRMLKRAKEQKIVEKTSNLWDLFFEGGKEHRVDPCRPLSLPYFEGDYIPGALEEYLGKIHQEQEEEKKAAGKKSKKTFKGSSSRGKGKRSLNGNESVDSQVMSRLGDQIKNMKDDFIMVHLQPICNYCRKYMVDGEKRFQCETCPNFELCERCYKDDCGLDERSRHPTGSLVVHKFKEIAPPQIKDTSDPDPQMECEIFETRQTFLSLCQGNHYQFDTFRRAKHSSMMVLYHLHNPTAPAFTSSCNLCNRELEPGQGFRCQVCTDYDVCAVCKNKPGFSHPHQLKKQSAQTDARSSRISEEERRARQEQLRKTMQLLVHASSCTDEQCPHPSCFKVKMLFQHSLTCQTKATGGCQYCRRMWALLQLHAKSCVTPNCPVPRCRDLKNYRRYAQAQAEQRRRMHYHKMMNASRQNGGG